MQNRNEAKCRPTPVFCTKFTISIGLYTSIHASIDSAIATSVENASCDYNYFYDFNFQGPLSCRLHRCAFTIRRSNTIINYRR